MMQTRYFGVPADEYEALCSALNAEFGLPSGSADCVFPDSPMVLSGGVALFAVSENLAAVVAFLVGYSVIETTEEAYFEALPAAAV